MMATIKSLPVLLLPAVIIVKWLSLFIIGTKTVPLLVNNLFAIK